MRQHRDEIELSDFEKRQDKATTKTRKQIKRQTRRHNDEIEGIATNRRKPSKFKRIAINKVQAVQMGIYDSISDTDKAWIDMGFMVKASVVNPRYLKWVDDTETLRRLEILSKKRDEETYMRHRRHLREIYSDKKTCYSSTYNIRFFPVCTLKTLARLDACLSEVLSLLPAHGYTETRNVGDRYVVWERDGDMVMKRDNVVEFWIHSQEFISIVRLAMRAESTMCEKDMLRRELKRYPSDLVIETPSDVANFFMLCEDLSYEPTTARECINYKCRICGWRRYDPSLSDTDNVCVAPVCSKGLWRPEPTTTKDLVVRRHRRARDEGGVEERQDTEAESIESIDESAPQPEIDDKPAPQPVATKQIRRIIRLKR